MGSAKRGDKVEVVQGILQKRCRLTTKQEYFCNRRCVERFLKDNEGSVKKAAKQLVACLSWRENIGADDFTADEFPTELSDGVAYVAGRDYNARPVTIFRLRQESGKFHFQKWFIRLLAFTLEVAIAGMPSNVEQFVILFDASCFRSASALVNVLLVTLKIIAEYYPGRLYKAFIVDPRSFFTYIWKGVRPFIELSASVVLVSTSELEKSVEFFESTVPYLRTPAPAAKIGACSSSRFTFTVSHHQMDTLKPWYLSFSDTSAAKVGPAISPLNARSLSFASPAVEKSGRRVMGSRSSRPSTPLTDRLQQVDNILHLKKPSFLQSPAIFFGKKLDGGDVLKQQREEHFLLLALYRRPYDEQAYRSNMRVPYCGLVFNLPPQVSHHRHVSSSQRF